jgi:hypothetical protein
VGGVIKNLLRQMTENLCLRSNKNFFKTNDPKPYLASVSGVDKFGVRGHCIVRGVRWYPRNWVDRSDTRIVLRHIGSTHQQLYQVDLGVCTVKCVGTVCAWDCAGIRMDRDSKYVLRKVVLDFVCLFVGMELLISFCNCRS